MVLPYSWVRMFKGEEPYPLDREDMNPQQQAEFLMLPGNMDGLYLGACLDSCRWGSMTSVMYKMNPQDMIAFIQSWMQQNKGIFERRFHEEDIDRMYNYFYLPHINHKVCPRDKSHRGMARDLGGRLRCTHKSKSRFRPSFIESYNTFDDHAQMRRIDVHERKPIDPMLEDVFDEDTGELLECYDEEREKYFRKQERYDEEEKSLVVTDACLAIISDIGKILSLETILRRLNIGDEIRTVYCNGIGGECDRVDELSESDKQSYGLVAHCPGHTDPTNELVFPFDGWTLAFYVQKWWNQLDGRMPPLFENSGDVEE
jgi:hypothetical protein